MHGWHALLCAVLFSSAMALAAEDYLIEEILVTAQRVEENARKVPISVSAFTDAMIEDRQIVGIWDLQLNVPNLTYTQENWGSSKVSIRGIGNLAGAIGGPQASRPSVPLHVNGVSTPMSMNVLEFYDLERLEVMRGPQGTLYGRNAVAGAINLITHRPDFDRFGGYADLEYGDHDHVRVKGALNVPVGERLAFRAAGMSLERDGYIENKAAGEIPGIDDDLDGRDFWAYRLTADWQPTDTLRTWLMYSRFDEDDSKVRIHNQVCKANDLPTTGCVPDEFGLEPPHPGSRVDVFLASLMGAVPFGARDESTGLVYEFPRPPLNLRQQYMDMDPEFEHEEEAWLFGVEWQLGAVTAELAGSYFEVFNRSRQERFNDVGFVLNPTASNPSGLWPTSDTSQRPGGLRGGGPCDLESVRAGVFGGCTVNDDLNRAFGYDQISSDLDFWSLELRFRSDFQGRFDFLLGANVVEQDTEVDLTVAINTFDGLGTYGLPQFGLPPGYPSFPYTDGERENDSYSVFGELYVALSETLKLTTGLRYSADESTRRAAGSINSARDISMSLGGALGDDPVWIRGTMGSYLGGAPNEQAQFLADYYGATSAIQAAADLEALVAALQIVPVTSRRGELQDFLDLPSEADWDEVTGRVVLDWTVSDDALLYASFTQGYRPGLLDAALVAESEGVDAYEIGVKSLWAEGSFAVNAAVFFNVYDDLQFERSPTGSLRSTDNLDAETMGLEVEVTWHPVRVPGLTLDLTYAWLDTEIKSEQALDRLNRTQGDADLILLSDIGAGAPIMSNYVAPVDQVLPQVDSAIASFLAIPAPGAVYDNGIPVYFSRAFLDANGVATSEGNLANLDGNELPNSPPQSVTAGLAYSWPLAPGTLTLRYDYYWQDQSYSREFNTRGDEIDSWVQHNASVTFESAGGRWSGRVWIRNLTDEDNVTGHWLHADDAGLFRNYFMSEPRIYGASLRYNFGVL